MVGGKGAELWDDSALITAFDAAMTSYKEMHAECSGRVLDNEKDDRDSKESDTVLTEKAKSGRQIESEGNNLDVEDNTKETCTPSCNNAAATNDPFTREYDVGANLCVPEFNPPVISEHSCVNPKFDGYSYHQSLNYDELLKQYNELEHRKEKIVEQLWQANYWNYQTQVQCPASQQQQISVSSGSELAPNSSCPWCTCQRPMVSVLPVGYACCPQHILCCSGSQVQQEAGVQTDDRAVETGSMPVELLRDSVERDLSRASNLDEETKKREDDASGKDLSSTNQKTNLISVINAWYWAGYHTGRYLLEQEQSDKLNKNTIGEKQLIVSEEEADCS